MKKHLITVSFILILFVFTDCKKNKIEYANENIVISTAEPGISIYKTKNDYFNYVTVGLDSSGNISREPEYNYASPSIVKNEDGSITYNGRWRLKSGYIVDKEMGVDYAFTDITFQELVEYIDVNGGDIPTQWFEERIINRNPFVEYYFADDGYPGKDLTLGEINEMLENGSIETVFTKIK